MYKILIKYDNDKLNLWMPYGTTTTSTTGNSEFTEFETDDVAVLKETILKLDKEPILELSPLKPQHHQFQIL